MQEGRRWQQDLKKKKKQKERKKRIGERLI
jgi:hypothetical protein